MKFKITASDLSKIYHLFEIKEINIALADMLNNYFQVVSPLKKADNTKEYLKGMIKRLGINPRNKENNEIIKKQLLPGLIKLDKKELLNDPYYQNIVWPTVKKGPYECGREIYHAYQAFPYDEITVLEKDYREVSKIAYYTEDVSYPLLTYQKKAWMSVTPNEIRTFKNPLEKAKGDVITFGLGMGYFIYMALLKKEVTTVTVVEKDEVIIDLFKTYLLPQFPRKEQVKIIHMDAYEFIKTQRFYDYAYVDLWHNPNDGLPFYEAFKKSEKNFPGCRFDYWLETSILALYRRCLLTLALEQLNNVPEDNYKKCQNATDKAINDLYFKTLNVTVYTYREFHRLCADESLVELIKQ